jgi:hypothetical protein
MAAAAKVEKQLGNQLKILDNLAPRNKLEKKDMSL